MYDGQHEPIGRILRDAGLVGVEVANVDAFQGREQDVVLLPMVRSNDEGPLGFVDDSRRVNAAFTRAKRGPVVAGDASTMQVATGAISGPGCNT